MISPYTTRPLFPNRFGKVDEWGENAANVKIFSSSEGEQREKMHKSTLKIETIKWLEGNKHFFKCGPGCFCVQKILKFDIHERGNLETL